MGVNVADMLPLTDAAARAGVSVDALRRRIRRGTITAEKRGDRWYVAVQDLGGRQEGAQDAPRTAPGGDPITQAMIAMQQQLDALQRQLDVKDRQLADAATERAELRRLLGNAQQTVLMLTGGSDVPQAAVEDQSAGRRGETSQRGVGRESAASQRTRRSWLRWWRGGEQ